MKKEFFILILFSVVLTAYLSAQTIRVDTTRHDQGTTEVIVYSYSRAGIHSTDPHHGNDKNIVKMGLLYWGTGVIPVYYERQINKWLTVQGGIGLTTRDFVADLVNVIIESDDEGNNQYYNYQHRKALVGFYVAAQPKFYVQSDAMDGFWIGPMLEFKRYNFKAQMVQENQTDLVYLTNSYQSEHRNALDFTINIGWQWMYNPLVVEFYMGGGFRRFWEQRQDIGTNDFSNTYANGVRLYNGYRPEFNLGLNFGGFF